MRDPYDVLGVAKNAGAADIKKAYRRLAKTHHPDRNKDDKTASSKFAELTQAYEIVGDDKQRKRFDSGEIDAEGKPRFQGFPGGGGQAGGFSGMPPGFEGFNFNFGGGGPRARSSRPGARSSAKMGGFEDIFSDLLGGAFGGQPQHEPARPSSKAQDVGAELHLSFLEAARGTERQIGLSNGKTLKVNIPAGVGAGSTLRLKGQASGQPGSKPGDVLLNIQVAPHPLFKLEGRNLRLTLPVTLDEAVLGAKIRVPTLDGPVELNIPADSNTGKTLRLKGKGIQAKDGAKEGAGDFLVTLEVVLPKEADKALKDYAAQLRALKPYSPRGAEFAL